MTTIKSVNVPVGKFSVENAIDLIRKHAEGRILQAVHFNKTSLLGGTLEIHTSPIPIYSGLSETDLMVEARKKRIGKTSKYIGVYWDKSMQKWRAQISINNKRELLRFDSEEEAARQYDAWARKYRGSKAVLNFPDRSDNLGI